jgi:tetratricopeptide (TPR) repeat protein
MSSHSRNSRKPIRTLQLAVAAAALAGSAAYADETGHFELTAFSNGTAGAALTSGDYNTALAQLQHANFLQNDTTSTNRCVAYSVTRRLEDARIACNAAVREAQQQLASMPVSMSWARSDYRDYLAVAYSNRAVLNWIVNDTRAAQSDLKKAAAVSPKAAFVARNETALETHAKFARVSLR